MFKDLLYLFKKIFFLEKYILKKRIERSIIRPLEPELILIEQFCDKTKSSIDNIPNVITPDGDRINDLFTVKTTEIKTFFISISYTQGNVVFESNDKDFEWDGTNLFGEKVESGTYIYTIIAEGEDGGVFKIPGQLYVRY